MSETEVRIGHSPDPDDAFLFYGLTQGKVGLPGIRVRHFLKGIEELNQQALAGELEMTAVSLHAYAYCAERYLLLRTGASVGDGCGPVIVTRRAARPEDLRRMTVAIPGRLTTAALLLRLAVGPVPVQILPFDEIPAAVREGRVEAGVLIHEAQITYAEQGLCKVLDLGEWWQKQTGLPVPLGVNVLRRDLGQGTLRGLAAALRESLDYAMTHRAEALAYAQQFGRGLDRGRTDRFVGMYVNRWSVDCPPDAAKAMQELLDRSAQMQLVPRRIALEFAEG